MRIVVLIEPVHEDGVALLRARDDVELVHLADLPEAERPAAVARAHGIGVRTHPLGEDRLRPARDLLVVSKHGVGCDNIAVDHLTARGVPVAFAPDANTVSVAEHALMLILALARRLAVQDAAVRAGEWNAPRALRALELDGRALLVVGYGRVGRRLAHAAAALGMRVLAHDPLLAAPEPGVEVAPDLDAALARADVVSLHLPLTRETANLLDARRLALMPPHALLVNCARGGLVDERALAEALAAGRLAGAGLDVFADEPPPMDHPLRRAPNALLLPHSGAQSDMAARTMAVTMAENILAAFDGRLDPALTFNRAGLAARAAA